VDWTLYRSVTTFAVAVNRGDAVGVVFQVTLALCSLRTCFYGLARPWVSKRWRREIESDEEDEETEER